MSLIHPAVMSLLILLFCYVARLGFIRLGTKRLGRKGVFPWKRHVLVGKVVLWGLFAGLGLGLLVNWLLSSAPFSTGLHVLTAVGIVPLASFGLATGLLLDRKPNSAPRWAGAPSRASAPSHYVGASRTSGARQSVLDRLGAGLGNNLPLLHAIGNAVLLLLVLCQIWTGIDLLG